MKKSLCTFFAMLLTVTLFAQNEVEMADKFYADGKIYVVVATVGVIVLGLFIYLFTIDRRLKKVEKYSKP